MAPICWQGASSARAIVSRPRKNPKRHRKSRVSTNPNEDLVYLEKPDTAFLSKAENHGLGKRQNLHHQLGGRALLRLGGALPSARTATGSHPRNRFMGGPLCAVLSQLSAAQPHHLCRYLRWQCRASPRRLFRGACAQGRSAIRHQSRAVRRRVEKRKGGSETVLPEFGIAGRRFDLAYIDGSHMAADVYRDAALTWPLMKSGGVILFDDYEWDLIELNLSGPTQRRRVPRGHKRRLPRDPVVVTGCHRGGLGGIAAALSARSCVSARIAVGGARTLPRPLRSFEHP